MKNWINVIDELPKVGQKVLVLTGGVVLEEVYMFDEVSGDDGEMWQFWSSNDSIKNVLKVSDYWAPLPEAI